MKKVLNFKFIGDVQKFVNDIRAVNNEVLILSGDYAVSGKSLLGILSLDLSKPVIAILKSELQDDVNKFAEICERYKD